MEKRSRIQSIEEFQDDVRMIGNVMWGDINSMEDVDNIAHRTKLQNPETDGMMWLMNTKDYLNLRNILAQITTEDSQVGILEEGEEATIGRLMLDLSFLRNGIDFHCQYVDGLEYSVIINQSLKAQESMLILNNNEDE